MGGAEPCNRPAPSAGGRSAISVNDPLQTYLREINRIPLLSAEMERQLALGVRTGNLADREQMIKANLRLVVNIAKTYVHRGLLLADLIEEGNVGLLRAVEGFDPGQGYRFSTYASWWIKQAIRRALLSKSKTIRIPAYMAEMISRWKSATSSLTDQLGRTPGETEVAEAMNIPLSRLRLIVMAVNSFASADQPLTSDLSLTVGDVLTDQHAKPPGEQVVDELEVENLKRLLGELPQRESDVLTMRYGLFGREPMTLKQIGQNIGLTRERIRQIENQALKRLRAMMTGGDRHSSTSGRAKSSRSPKS